MGKGTPFSDTEREQMLDMHGQGASLTKIAKALGRSPATISKHAAAAGISFDTAPTRVAVASHRDRAAALRASLQVKLLERTETVLDLLDGGTPVREIKDLMSAASYGVAASMRIHAAEQTSGEADHSDVDAWLTHMTGGSAGRSAGGGE